MEIVKWKQYQWGGKQKQTMHKQVAAPGGSESVATSCAGGAGGSAPYGPLTLLHCSLLPIVGILDSYLQSLPKQTKQTANSHKKLTQNHN